MQTNLQQQTNLNTVTSQQNHKKKAKEFKHHVWSYIASIVLTALAFLAVGYNVIESPLVIGMFILLLAVVQVVFQLYIWMHMNEKGHEMPQMFILGGASIAIITVAALMLLIWW